MSEKFKQAPFHLEWGFFMDEIQRCVFYTRCQEVLSLGWFETLSKEMKRGLDRG